MHHSKYVLLHALILSTIGAMAEAPLRAAGSEWDDLAVLEPGQQIRVVLNDAQSHQGAFQALNDQGITLGQAAGEQTFARKDVRRVCAYYGVKNHRLRNIVIGAAVGAGLAILAVLSNRNLYNSWWHSSAWVWEVFLPAGAGMGAAIPTAGWHEVYRAHEH